MVGIDASRARRAIAAICGVRALSWRVGVWGFGATSVLNLVSDPYVDFRSSFSMAWVPFLASVPPLLLMLMVNMLVRRRIRMRPLIVGATYLVACGIRPVFLSLFVDLVNPAEPNNPLLRPYGTAVTFAILVVVSFSINVVGDFQRAMNQMKVTRERLRGALTLAHSELDRPTQRLDSTVRTMIDDVISDIRLNLTGPRNSGQLQELADGITIDSTNRIRTLGREYARRWSKVDSIDADSPMLWQTADLLRAAASRNVYAPLTVAALTAGAMTYAVLPRSPNPSLALVLIAVWFTVTAVLSMVARWSHGRLWPSRDRHAVWQGIFFYSSTFVAAETASFVTGVVGPGFNVPVMTQFVVAPFVAVAIAACVGLGAGLADANVVLLEQSAQTTAEISRVLARVNAQRLRTQGAVSHFLHGRVQGQLIAASLLVRTRLEAGESVEQVRERIDNLLDEITLAELDSIDPPTLQDGLESLVRPWLNILSLTTEISDEVRAALDGDPLGRFIFFDVANEAINNAVKHAHATHVSVTAALVSPVEIEVGVVNDGVPWRRGEETGLGSHSLHSITTSMVIETTDAGSVLRVSIPVAPVTSRDY